MKIAINKCYGGFGLSDKAFERLIELGMTVGEEFANSSTGKYYLNIKDREMARTDPRLIQVIEELGDEASGKFADIKIVEVPDDVKWQIDEYDGIEWVAEVHRTW